MKRIIRQLLNFLGYDLVKLPTKFNLEMHKESKIVEITGSKLRVNPSTYIGQELIKHKIWERDTTHALEKIVKPGFFVMDVGSNIGYFSILFGRLVGSTGKVFCFEPTKFYRDQLKYNISLNKNLQNVSIYPFGLSDKNQKLSIRLSDSTASLHHPDDNSYLFTEEIELKRLDDVWNEFQINKLDLIKVDIDGHEPFFLSGAAKTLKEYKPILLMEFSQCVLYQSGNDVRDLYYTITRDFNYIVYNEKSLQPYKNMHEFLMDCGNYNISCNALAVHTDAKFLINSFNGDKG